MMLHPPRGPFSSHPNVLLTPEELCRLRTPVWQRSRHASVILRNRGQRRVVELHHKIRGFHSENRTSAAVANGSSMTLANNTSVKTHDSRVLH